MLKSAVRAVILEEVAARMLALSGYRLLTKVSDDPRELTLKPNGLNVKGRGAYHQADALGEFISTPRFTYPIRLFVEAKSLADKVEVDEVREAVGLLADVNSRYFTRGTKSGPRTKRYDYRLVFFSTSGFSQNAVNLAIAHGVALGDLSGPRYASLRSAINTSAEALSAVDWRAVKSGRITQMSALRACIRAALATSSQGSNFVARVDRDADGRTKIVASKLTADFQAQFVTRRGAQLGAMQLTPALRDALQTLLDSLAQEIPIILGFGREAYPYVLRPRDPETLRSLISDAGDGTELSLPVALTADQVADSALDYSSVPPPMRAHLWSDVDDGSESSGAPGSGQDITVRLFPR
jgi:hypothetical protein